MHCLLFQTLGFLYVLNFLQLFTNAHPEFGPTLGLRSSDPTVPALDTSPWQGWNWPVEKTKRFEFARSQAQQELTRDWTWKSHGNEDQDPPDHLNFEPISLREEPGRSNSFLLPDQHRHLTQTEEQQRPLWPHQTYDPYAFQTGGDYDHQADLNLQLKRPNYEWQTLQRPPHRLNFDQHFQSNALEVAPQHDGGGSGGSASNYQAIVAPSHALSFSTGSAGAQNGLTTEWNSSDRKHDYNHYQPHQPRKYYKRKRYRVAIHPGFIAAPIAGLAAFGAVHAFTSNPLLLELGLVDKTPPAVHPNKPHVPHNPTHHLHEHDHHHHHQIIPVPYPYPHNPTQPTPPPNHPHHQHPHFPSNPGQGGHGHGHGHPEVDIAATFPILHPHPTSKPNEEASESKPWWSPFAAIIPRLRNEQVERD